jgi:hypothetical protein
MSLDIQHIEAIEQTENVSRMVREPQMADSDSLEIVAWVPLDGKRDLERGAFVRCLSQTGGQDERPVYRAFRESKPTPMRWLQTSLGGSPWHSVQ